MITCCIADENDDASLTREVYPFNQFCFVVVEQKSKEQGLISGPYNEASKNYYQ